MVKDDLQRKPIDNLAILAVSFVGTEVLGINNLESLKLSPEAIGFICAFPLRLLRLSSDSYLCKKKKLIFLYLNIVPTPILT